MGSYILGEDIYIWSRGKFAIFSVYRFHASILHFLLILLMNKCLLTFACIFIVPYGIFLLFLAIFLAFAGFTTYSETFYEFCTSNIITIFKTEMVRSLFDFATKKLRTFILAKIIYYYPAESWFYARWVRNASHYGNFLPQL